jgi:3-oxoacyl-[acyl-carrier-protein] synthase-3
MEEMMGVKITGLGMHLPEKMLDNKYFESILDTSDQWITERTGIKIRYFSSQDEAASDLAYPACLEAIEKAKISKDDIELIIVATVTPDYLFPTTACVLQDKLGIKPTAAFDLLAGCTGFIYGAEIARNFIETKRYKTILVVAVEELSKILDINDRNTAVLFGDGAAAAIFQYVENEKGILSSYISADGSKHQNLIMPAGGSKNPTSTETIKERLHYIKMDGRAVFRDAVSMMIKATKEALERANLKKEDIDLFIPHQANIRIIEAIAKYFEIDKEKVYITVDKYANISAATIPIALYDAEKNGKIKKGMKVLLTAFGAGFTFGAMVLEI